MKENDIDEDENFLHDCEVRYDKYGEEILPDEYFSHIKTDDDDNFYNPGLKKCNRKRGSKLC